VRSHWLWRGGLFAAAILLVAGVLGWRAWVAWRETEALRVSFARTHRESEALADYYKAEVLKMNQALLRHGLTGDAASRARFLEARGELRAWLNEESATHTLPRNQTVLAGIRRAFDEFAADADRLLAARTNDAGALPVQQLLDKIEADSRALLVFASNLNDARRAEADTYLARAERAVAVLHTFTLAALGTLFALSAVLGWIVWRDLIQPLRARLVRSTEILEHQEKLSSLGVLAAGLAHEIRNPLTRLLRTGSPEREDAQVISAEIARLEQIVNDVLQFSRPPEPRPTLLNAARLFEDARRLFAPELERRRVEVAVETGDETPFPGDPEQLKQVLLNLLTNAADATGPGGRIRLASRRLSRRLRGAHTAVMALDITDNGPGMPPEVQRRLFDPFFTTKSHGTGLGLSLAARILERHGGALEWRTQPGAGTTFTLLLPLVSAVAAPEPVGLRPAAVPA
jgi:signal transduction histidine kinase